MRQLPVLLIHGGHHGRWFWDPWRAVLGGVGWRCVAIDLLGHGSPPIAPDAFVRVGVERYAQDIADAASPFKGACIIIAHSLGALAAQLYVASHPIHALVLVTPSPPGNLRIEGDPLVPESVPITAPGVCEMRARWFHRRPHRQFGSDEAVRACLVPESPRAVNDRHANRIACARISSRTLVIGAQYDRRHGGGESDRLTANYHRADFMCARGHGHDLCIEDGTELIVDLVDAWLRMN